MLSWPDQGTRSGNWLGPLLVGVACLCWAIDNNLSRKVSASDALFIASSKGMVAGLANTLLAVSLSATLPSAVTTLETIPVGPLGYGFSLVMFVLALRGWAPRAPALTSPLPLLLAR